MKVAVIGPLFTDSSAKNICVTLEAMGHEVWNHPGTRLRHNKGRWHGAFWTNAPKIVPALDSSFLNGLCRGIEAFAPGLVLSTHDYFDPPTLQRIQRLTKAPAACWFTDAVTNLGNGRLFAMPYDHFYFKEPLLVDVFRNKIGRDARYLPEGCNPMWRAPIEPSDAQQREYGCDVATQGTLHPYRAAFFDVFDRTDIQVKIWGVNIGFGVNNPSRRYFTGKYIGEQEKAVAFRCAKIVLNNMNYGEVSGVNQTLFDATGAGAFVMCDEKSTLPSLFNVGEEVVTFKDQNDMMQKVRYYLSPQGEEERRAIRERGRRRAHAEHTMEHRLRVILADAV